MILSNAFLFLVLSCAAVFSGRVTNHQKYCYTGSNFVPYNRAKSVCCNRRVVDVEDALSYNCCRSSGEIYHKNFDLCCKKVIKNASPYLGCCNEVQYSVTEKTCCQGILSSYPTNLHNDNCCGKIAYDVEQETCCGGIPWKIPNGQCCVNPTTLDEEAFDPENNVCCQGKIHNMAGGKQCCGSDLFDPETEICCDDKILKISPKNSNPKCCKQSSGLYKGYDESKQICCQGIVQDKSAGPNSECCGAGQIDTTSEICCQNNPQSTRGGKTECCAKYAYNAHEETCCSGKLTKDVANGKCCGDVAFFESKQTCCSKVLIDEPSHLDNKCCGGKIIKPVLGKNLSCCGEAEIDLNNQLCCNGFNVLDKKHPHEKCCGKQTYNYMTQTCCDPEILDNVPVKHGDCCVNPQDNTWKAYDKRKNVCCKGQLGCKDCQCCGSYPYRKSDNLTCINFKEGPVLKQGSYKCGLEVYDPSDAICCSGKKNPRVFSNSGCCNGVVINADSQTCCGGFLTNLPDATSKCCDKTAYNPETHICSGLPEKVHPKPPRTRKHIPAKSSVVQAVALPGAVNRIRCGRTVFNTEGKKMKCCGEKAYVPSDNTHICCRGHLHNNCFGRSQCCGVHPYNPAIETCCAGVITGGTNLSCCGAQGFDKDRKICCSRKHLYEKSSSSDACCGKKSYGKNDSSKLCCKGVLHEISDSSTRTCCGNFTINPNTEECCGDKNRWTRGLHSGCCAGSLYDTSSHFCCGNTIYSIATHACCHNVAYNLNTGQCCSTIIQEKSNPKTQCCRNKPYNNLTHVCKQDGIIKRKRSSFKNNLFRKICSNPIALSGNVVKEKGRNVLTNITVHKSLNVLPSQRIPVRGKKNYVPGTMYLFVGRMSKNGIFDPRNGLNRKLTPKNLRDVEQILTMNCK